MSVLTARRGRSSEREIVEQPIEPTWTTDSLDYVALAIVGILVALIAGRAPVPIKEVFVLAFMSYVPGRAFVTHWAWAKGAVLALMTVVGSLAVTTLVVTATVWLHLWGPVALFYVGAVGSSASIVVGIAKRRRRLGSTPPAEKGRHLAQGVGYSDLRGIRLRPSGTDVLLVLSVLLFGFGISATQLGRIDRWGLLPALSMAFYAGFALLIVSIIWLLGSRRLSSPRLVVHLAALVLMIAGTPALVYPVPRYPWLYKHIGVVQYINLHGSVNRSIDIYHNWPGFFALIAWFDRVAGASSPIRFAAWSETVVMLISCLAVYTAARQLRMAARERWIGLFIFVIASWVDQVYFSPQALAYALSLSFLALVLCWYQHDDPARWVEWVRKRTSPLTRLLRNSAAADDHQTDLQHPAATNASPGWLGIAVTLAIFSVLVFVHQLSPYVVALQLSVLAIFGRVRPRWLAVALWVIAIGYLLPRFTYVSKAYGLLDSFGNFFSNTQTSATAVHPPYDLGVRVAARAADAITLLVWSCAAVGVVRRVRAGRPTMVLSVLAFSPLITFFLTNYGGEAEYRVYFFSVPWVSLLAASAFASESPRHLFAVGAFATAFALLGALIFPAYVGDDEIYVVPPSEVSAANYFYSHAQPGSALILAAPNFPGRVSGRYDQYLILKNEVDPNLLSYPQFGSNQPLGAKDLPNLRDFAATFTDGGRAQVYIAFAASGFASAKAYNLAPSGALASLESAMQKSPEWSVYLKNSSTTIFIFHPVAPVQP